MPCAFARTGEKPCPTLESRCEGVCLSTGFRTKEIKMSGYSELNYTIEHVIKRIFVLARGFLFFTFQMKHTVYTRTDTDTDTDMARSGGSLYRYNTDIARIRPLFVFAFVETIHNGRRSHTIAD